MNAGWRTELEEVVQALDGFALRGRVLELAGGTGIWTKQLAQTAAELTVVDASPEMLGINRDRVRDPYVRYITADLFELAA
ncbi:MAG: methyltransferase domain-containing protein [Chloroflexi bacterium]|nr:MAG: methyltransferase domain-containing protein [Chloroflexota bacterium]